MHYRILGAAVPLATAIALAAPAQAFDIDRADTEAEIRLDASGAPILQLGLRAELSSVPPDPIFPPEPVVPPEPVKVIWQSEEGVPPEPIVITIPLSCFTGDGEFRVEGAECGVRMTFDPDGAGPIGLTVGEFEARLALREGDRLGSARFDLEATLTDESLLRPLISALGGAGLSLGLNSSEGPETASATPLEVETIAFPPEPIFPPDPI